MRVIFAGSRTTPEADARTAWDLCSLRHFTTTLLSGGARGADAWGEKLAREHGVSCLRIPADWQRWGRAAGPIRNREMANLATGLIAVWDGHSSGTKNMIELARARGLWVQICIAGQVTEHAPHGERGVYWRQIADSWNALPKSARTEHARRRIVEEVFLTTPDRWPEAE